MENPKILFNEVFGDEFPSIQEGFLMLSAVFGEDVSCLGRRAEFLLSPAKFRFDSNVFSGLFWCLSNDSKVDEDMLKYFCLAQCGQCKDWCRMDAFVSSLSHFLTKRCYACRKDNPVSHIPRMVYARVTAPPSAKMIDLFFEMHRVNLKAGEALRYPVDTLLWRASDNESFCLTFMGRLTAVGEYNYISNQKRSERRKSTVYICSQRRFNVANQQRNKRLRESKKKTNCGGTECFSPNGILREVQVLMKHEDVHERHPQSCKVSSDTKQIIQDCIVKGMSPFPINEFVRAQYHPNMKYQAVYNAWTSIIEQMIRKSKDRKESVDLYFNDSKRLSTIYRQMDPYEIRLLTTLGQNICTEKRVILIDSTYKTNSSKIELFSVIGSIKGAGFPIAYFLLEPPPPNTLPGYRKASVASFLAPLYTSLYSFRPMFFFSDKDNAQLNAISIVLKVSPSICLWHMKRVIKQNWAQLSKLYPHNCTAAKQEELLKLISRHFHLHPFNCGITVSAVGSLCRFEIDTWLNQFLDDALAKDLQSYLHGQWYDEDKFGMWGCRHPEYIPIAKTNMLVDAHWSVLKRLYLTHYNRPCSDLLVYILDVKFLSKFESDYVLLCFGQYKPSWWREFVRDWKKAACSVLNTNHQTNRSLWTCSCPAFIQSRFAFCKHLVHGLPCPQYRSLERGRRPPSQQFLELKGVFVPRFREEERRNNDVLQVQVPNVPSLDTVADFEIEAVHPRRQLSEILNARSILEWVDLHLTELSSSEAYAQHTHYFLERILRLREIESYKTDVEKILRAHHTPTTWGSGHTVFLP